MRLLPKRSTSLVLIFLLLALSAAAGPERKQTKQAIIDAANWLAAQQLAGGGFPATKDGAVADIETQCTSALGMLDAYRIVGEADQLASGQATADSVVPLYPRAWPVEGTPMFYPGDPAFLLGVCKIAGDASYGEFVASYLWDPLSAGTYGDSDWDAADLGDSIIADRKAQGVDPDHPDGYLMLAAHDLALLVQAAHEAGEADIRDAFLAKIEETLGQATSSGQWYDALGLASAVWASGATGCDMDIGGSGPYAGLDTREMAALLASWQGPSGGFCQETGSAEHAQGTAWGILALQSVGTPTYDEPIAQAVGFIKDDLQQVDGQILIHEGADSYAFLGVPHHAEAESGLSATQNMLYLEPEAPSFYLQPGEEVTVDLNVASLAQPVNACQAMLGYSTDYFEDPVFGEGCVEPGGDDWDWVIWDSWYDGSGGTPGEIDAAIGVWVNGGVGTQDDGIVCKITLTSKAVEGSTRMVFRPDDLYDDTEQSLLADLDGYAVWPSKVNSVYMVVDGTDPLIDIISARQGSNELLGPGAPNGVQGDVIITVAASDALAGLDGVPSVIVTPSGGPPEDITSTGVDNGDGTFSYTYTILPTTPNGVATIDAEATDRSGNSACDSDTFNINKNQIAGTIEFDTLSSAVYEFDRLVVFKATNAGGTVLATWKIAIHFTNDTVRKVASGSYALTEAPGATANLSAKTAWSLRRKQPSPLDSNGQAAVDYVGSKDLRGGDIDPRHSNTVNVLDYSVLKAHWYTSHAEADINGDGQVAMLDYAIMKSNWFANGDPQ